MKLVIVLKYTWHEYIDCGNKKVAGSRTKLIKTCQFCLTIVRSSVIERKLRSTEITAHIVMLSLLSCCSPLKYETVSGSTLHIEKSIVLPEISHIPR